MRLPLAFALVSTVAACGSSMMTGDDDDDTLMPPTRGFQVETSEVTIQPGEDVTYCYYFKTTNTEMLTIKRWVSHMNPGSHHMILFFSPTLQQPEGTLTTSNCSIFSGGGGGSVASWVYSTQAEDSDLTLPADDGAGTPVGMDVPPNQPGFIQLHYSNRGDTPLVAKVTLNAEAYDAGVATTKTAAYFTFDANINIPAHATGYKESVTCDFPAGKKAWLMSTHTHRHAVQTRILDGSSPVFSDTDWAHPAVQLWETAPFYTFPSGKITSECTWDNPDDTAVTMGESAITDEMCMASGYVFPATTAQPCIKF